MSRTREYRIQQDKRKKREARERALSHGYKPSERDVGILATTPALCSLSSCCGNPRIGNGESSKTMQERKNESSFNYAISDINSNGLRDSVSTDTCSGITGTDSEL